MALKIFNAATAWVLSTLPASVKPAHRQWSNLGRNGEDGADGLLADDPLNMPLHRRVTDDSFNDKLHASNHAHDDLRQTAVAKPRRCNIFATDSSAYGFVLAGILLTSAVVFAWHRWLATPLEFFDRALLPCGVDTFYAINNHTCTTGNFLCPVVDRHRSLRCGDACYLPSMHRCLGNELSPIIADNPDRHAVADDADSAGCDAQFLRLSDGLFENYFLSDCSSSSQVVVTSPTPKDQHDLGDSRLLFAWAAGNSGIVMFFQSQGGPKNATTMRIRHGDGHNHTLTPLVSGVSGTLDLLLPATLGMTILGSVRSLRDFTEGGRVWDSDVQDGLHFKPLAGGGLLIKRQWLDQTTETFVTLRPSKDNPGRIRVRKQDIYLPSGGYDFQAWHNYPFVRNLGASHILNSYHQQLIDAQPDQVSSLSFLSYNDKITAGAWRFLTYFGRDSLLSLLLSQPILSEGETGIIEIILSTVLERINAADGSVCHEEVIGDYATLLNKREGLDSADPRCDYKMVDTDFLLPIALEAYLVKSSIGRERATGFLAKKATFLATNRGISYSDLALATINKVMKDTEAFEQEPVAKNLIRIRNGESVGQWRDSSDGLGGGRTPYDVNTALVPAALQAISSLAKHGIISNDDDWFTLAKARANFWEENTLHFFRVQIPPEGAQALMDEYTSYSEYTGPEAVPRFSNNVTFHGVALRQASDDSVVPVMNTDDCFRLFLLKPTHDEQLSSFLQQAADNILTSFPVGLSTPLGLVVSNPAYAGDARLAGALTTGAYHGTVVWSWQMAMMAAGLGRQLARCEIEKLAFCTNKDLLRRVEVAYSHLWDLIDANRDHLDREVWSWTYGPDEKFHYAPLGTLPGPGGQSAVESNVQQLWSLAFLALRRNDTLIHGVE